MKILTNYDFNKNQILNVGLQQLGSHPSGAVQGQIYFNTVDKRAYIFDGTDWKGSDALDAVMTAAKIVQAINSSSETILDLRLSTAAQSAIAKAHDIQTIATVPGLQAALDGKVANARVKTDVPAGALFTDTTYTNGAGLELAAEEFAVKFGTTANTVPHGNDARFSDSRTPKAHIHGQITNDGKIGTAANLIIKTGVGGELAAMPSGAAGQYLAHDGSWGTPPNHNTTYTNGLGLTLAGTTFAVNFGTAINTVPHGNDARFSDTRVPKSHIHGKISNEGKIGTTAGLIIKTGVGGELDTMDAGTSGQYLTYNGTWATPPNTNTTYQKGTGLTLTGTTFAVDFGSTVNTVPHANDPRFSDARTPLAHSHGKITNDGKIGTVAGLMLKTGAAGAVDTMAAGAAGEFLSHNGAWATPPNQTYPVFGAAVNGLVPMTGATSENSFLRSDGVWIPQEETAYNLPTATTTILGGVKASTSLSISAATGVATVVDNSHKHTTANITGLDTTLGTLATKTVAQNYADTAKGLAATYTDEQIAILVGTAPTTLDTLHEIAVALGSDPNFATTMTNLIGSKTGKFTKVLTAATSQIVTHNLGTRDVAITIRESAAPYAQVITDVHFTSADTITVQFAKAPVAGEYTITIIG